MYVQKQKSCICVVILVPVAVAVWHIVRLSILSTRCPGLQWPTYVDFDL